MLVADEREIVVREVENRPDRRVELHSRQRIGVSPELGVGLSQVVEIQVRVSQGEHELAGLEPRHLRDHHREQGVRCDVERHPEEDVRAALVELAGEPSFRHVELEQEMAWRQGHAVYLADVPGRNDVAPGVRVAADAVHDARDLIDRSAVRGRPAPPLRAVDRTQLSVLVGPLVPDGHAVGVEVADVRRALEKPQELVNDRAHVDRLRGHHRESRREVEAHLVAEDAQRAGAGAVAPAHPVLADVAHQVEVLLHASRPPCGS